jgi:putative membrane protein
MMWGYYDGWNWFWMAPMMILLWGGIIALAFFVIRSLAGSRSNDQAMGDLRRRFASGDITQDEFEKRRKALQG